MALQFSGNPKARMASVVSIKWDQVAGDPPFVAFDRPQDRTSGQKAQARENIRAAQAYDVTFYGAGKGGDDTLAFSRAAKAAPAASVQVLQVPDMPACEWATVWVPAGEYTLDGVVDTGGREIVWEADVGAVIYNVTNLNGRLSRSGSKTSASHSGILETACSYSVISNPNPDRLAQVYGILNPNQLSQRGAGDTVAFYTDNVLPPALYGAGAVTSYSATGAQLATALSSDQLKRMRVGMLVRTRHAPQPYAGVITGWSATSITVTSWYLVDGSASGPETTPTGTDGLDINVFKKAWSHNSNLFITPTSYGNAINAFELAIRNTKGEPGTRGGSVEANGLYSVNLAASTYYGEAAFLSGGNWTYGYRNQGSVTHAFAYSGNFAPSGDGLTSLLWGTNGSNRTFFQIDNKGDIHAGEQGAASTVTLAFHSGATNVAGGDCRITATGGTGSADGGNLFLRAAQVTVTAPILNMGNMALRINDTDGSHPLVIKPGSNLTGTRIFTLTTGDVDRTLNIAAADVTFSVLGADIVSGLNAAAVRSTLLLGTAATQNTGTSGANVPLLNGANTWSAAQTVSTTTSGASVLDALCTNDDDVAGPIVRYRRVSSSPAANDAIGLFQFLGRDSVGTDTAYADIGSIILDPTDGSEDGEIRFRTRVAASLVDSFGVASGVRIGSASYMGAGTLNLAMALYVGGVKVLGAQGAAIADASGGATVDTEARAAINALLSRMRAHGAIAT